MSFWGWLQETAWPFLYAVGERFVDDEGWVRAGYLAFSGMLALFPFLIFATALAGMLIGPEGGQAVLEQLFLTLPDYVARTLEPVILEVVGQPPGALVALAGFGSIYAASNGIEALRVGFDRAYDVEAYRHIAWSWLISIGFVILGFALFVLLATLFVLAPIGFHLIEVWSGTRIPRGTMVIRYGLGFAVLAGTLWGMHRVLPSRRMRGLRLLPGIFASMVLWTVAASVFSLYLSFTPYYTLTYGTLAGVVVALLFMYFSSAVVILGAEINAIVNRDELARRGARRAETRRPHDAL